MIAIIFILVTVLYVYHLIMSEVKATIYQKLGKIVTGLIIDYKQYNDPKILSLIKRMNIIVSDKQFLSLKNILKIHSEINEDKRKIAHKEMQDLEKALSKEHKAELLKFEQFMRKVIIVNIFTTLSLISFKLMFFTIIGLLKSTFIKSYNKVKNIQFEFETETILNPTYKLSA